MLGAARGGYSVCHFYYVLFSLGTEPTAVCSKPRNCIHTDQAPVTVSLIIDQLVISSPNKLQSSFTSDL